MKRLGSLPLLLLCLVVLRPPAAWAWGTEAHRVIASIAEARLSPAARAGVASLLHGDTLASVSMWADQMRANHPDTVRWHHVMIPLDADNYVAARDCRPSAQGDCVIAALQRSAATLHDSNATWLSRLEALKLIVHLIGDEHQPLDCVSGIRSGYDVPVTFFGHRTDLHEVWDLQLIEHSGLRADQLSDRLKAKADAMAVDGTIVSWAEESHRVAREQLAALPADRVLGQAYYDAALPVVEQQLLRAGVRLAAVLNNIFAPAQ